jgi:hypothetical protein
MRDQSRLEVRQHLRHPAVLVKILQERIDDLDLGWDLIRLRSGAQDLQAVGSDRICPMRVRETYGAWA